MRLLALAMAIAACKDASDRPASAKAPANDVWPEAPRPTRTAHVRLLRYQPVNLTGYRIEVNGGTPKGSLIRLDVGMTLDLVLRDGKTPDEREATLRSINLEIAGLASAKLRVDNNSAFVDFGEGTPHRWSRGEPGPFDVAEMVDHPFSTLVIADGRRLTARPNTDHPIAALQMGDLLDSGLVLFPDLPAEPIAPGHHWTVARTMPIGAGGIHVDVDYRLIYAGDAACPSGRDPCALLELEAASNGAIVNGMTVTYAFTGKLFFDLERGILDESHVRASTTVTRAAGMLTVLGSYVIRPI